MSNSNGNGFTQKEMLTMVLDKLEEVDNKLENKIDRKEFYTILGTIVAIITLVGNFML
jgi:hypothetical protein